MANYTKPSPASPSSLISADQPQMTENSNYLPECIGKDHNFTNTSNTSLTNADGYHTVIHQVSQVGDPAPITATNQIYSKSVTFAGGTDTQLFNITGLGGVSQLTGAHAAANGYQWIGSVLIQWGIIQPQQLKTNIVNLNANPNNVTFPNNIFNITFGLLRPTATGPGSDRTYWIDQSSIAVTGFNIINGSGNGDVTRGFYWMAVGN